MRQRTAQIQETSQVYLGQVGEVLVQAARQCDSPGGMDTNERIKFGHILIDLWIKNSISVMQMLLANPLSAQLKSMKDCKPWPSEPVEVEPKPYPRTILPNGPLTRVGLPSSIISASHISFEPAVLEVNKTSFTIHLLDYRFVGANYTGKVKLVPLGDGTVDEPQFTVGL